MGQRIIHQPRVAWDFARTLVDVAEGDDDLYVWFSGRLGGLLGAESRQQLFDTRHQLAQPVRSDARQVQIGLWRTRLEDLLRSHGDLAEDLRILGLHANSLLSR